MFVGHYAAAFAAKTIEPRAPLWTYVGACQLLDIGWSVLIMAGVEKMRLASSAPGGVGMDLYYMPYTHSLPGALAWSASAALLCAMLLRLPWRAALLVGLTVFSHWALDLLVHHPDLAIGFGGPKVGLSFWDYPIPEMALELGLVAVAGAAWTASRKQAGRTAWPAVLFIAYLGTLQVVASLSPNPSEPVTTGATALALYLLTIALAGLVDRRASPRGA
jgi:hypothetical protein